MGKHNAFMFSLLETFAVVYKILTEAQMPYKGFGEINSLIQVFLYKAAVFNTIPPSLFPNTRSILCDV